MYKRKLFNNAVIIHDSIFIHKRFPFEKLLGKKVVSLWHFNPDTEDFGSRQFLTDKLKNNHEIKNQILNSSTLTFNDKWYGCFGVQCFINLQFLEHIESKYNLFKLLIYVTNKLHRCALERIFGAIFCIENQESKIKKSLFGEINKYCKWGYTYENYIFDLQNRKKIPPIVKIWTGR